MNKLPKHSFALEYHENTKVLSGTQPFDPRNQYKIYPSSKTIKLDKIDYTEEEQNKSGFIRTLLSRKSTRAFAQDGISFRELSQLLTLSFGLRGIDFSGISLRTYASAGARYPIEVYPVILRSNDIELGIYHYNVVENSLELIKTGDYTNQMHEFYKNQQFVLNAPCIIFFSMVFERSMVKYGERGYRFIFLDAGHMSQNLYLTAEYLGLGVVALGAGVNSDDEIDDLIGLVHKVENVFCGFAVGLPHFVTD